MPRRPYKSDEEVDQAIANFARKNGTPPTIAQLRELLPDGIGNGRASKLLRRAKQISNPHCSLHRGGVSSLADDAQQSVSTVTPLVSGKTVEMRIMLSELENDMARREQEIRAAVVSDLRHLAHNALDRVLDEMKVQ